MGTPDDAGDEEHAEPGGDGRAGPAPDDGEQATDPPAQADPSAGESAWTEPAGEEPSGGTPAGAGGDRTPATAGAVAAALALFGTIPWWPGEPFVAVSDLGSPVGSGAALLTALAFGLGRHGYLPRDRSAPVAGVGGAALVVVSTVRLVAPGIGGGVVSSGYGLPVALVGGIAAIGMATADYRGVDADGLAAMGRAVGVVVGLMVAGFLGVILTSALLQPLPQLASSEAGEFVVRLVLNPLALAGFVVVALAYVHGSGRGWAYIDFEWPTLLEAVLAVLGGCGLLVFQVVVGIVITVLDLPSSSQATVTKAAKTATELGRPELLLVMVPLMLLVVGPIEELFFRNVLQKRLYDAFGRKSAVLVAGLLFSGAHLLSYGNENAAAVFVSLSAIFLLSLPLGLLYEYTDNVTVTAFAHGFYNAILIVLLYVAIVARQLTEGSVGWLALLI